MRSIFITLLALAAVLTACWYFLPFRLSFANLKTAEDGINSIRNEQEKHLRDKVNGIKPYLQRNAYNTDFILMADLGAPSGKRRFYFYDVKGDSVLYAGLVTHGRCNEDWLKGRRYSNISGSGCSSPGKYKVGYKYHGRFGLAYKLHGLDASNSRAFERYIVMHAHECVPDAEIYPSELCQSDGCPTLSVSFLKQVGKKIDGSKKPVILWMFE